MGSMETEQLKRLTERLKTRNNTQHFTLEQDMTLTRRLEGAVTLVFWKRTQIQTRAVI